MQEEKEDESAEYKEATNASDYSQDAPQLLQLGWVGRSTLGPSTDPSDQDGYYNEM